MFVALSHFTIPNGMAEEVRQAVSARSHLVDKAQGCIGDAGHESRREFGRNLARYALDSSGERNPDSVVAEYASGSAMSRRACDACTLHAIRVGVSPTISAPPEALIQADRAR